jgi:hypothetical protein
MSNNDTFKKLFDDEWEREGAECAVSEITCVDWAKWGWDEALKRIQDIEAENVRYPTELAAALSEIDRLKTAIKEFAYAQRWAHQSWKDQPAIKPLFDIAEDE